MNAPGLGGCVGPPHALSSPSGPSASHSPEGPMRSALLCLAALATAAFTLSGHSPAQKRDPFAGHIAASDPRTPADEKKCFHLPPGFEAQLVAVEPEINKPINIAFDDRGRLWVTSTVEYPYPAPPGRKARDAVKVLEDFGPDGRARKVTT